jgi:hypothetical protein
MVGEFNEVIQGVDINHVSGLAGRPQGSRRPCVLVPSLRMKRLDINRFGATESPLADVDPVHPSPKACSSANCALIYTQFSTNRRHYDPGTLAISLKSQMLVPSPSRRINHSCGTPQERIAFGIRRMQPRRDWATALRHADLGFRFGH